MCQVWFKEFLKHCTIIALGEVFSMYKVHINKWLAKGIKRTKYPQKGLCTEDILLWLSSNFPVYVDLLLKFYFPYRVARQDASESPQYTTAWRDPHPTLQTVM